MSRKHEKMKEVSRDLLEDLLHYNKKCFYVSMGFTFLFVSCVPVSPLMFLLSFSSLFVSVLYNKEVAHYEQRLEALNQDNSDIRK